MICVIITDIQNTERDCRDMRQPLSLLTSELREYVDKTKNEKAKRERIYAYSTLLLSLKKLFSIDNPIILKNENGKPYILGSKVYFNISHSDGVAVVAISDEGEVGIDVQSPVCEEKEKRLCTRFLNNIEIKNDCFSISYFLCENGELRKFTPELSTKNDFLSRWTFAEANIKCKGKTFSDISMVNELSNTTLSQTTNYKSFKVTTVVEK